MTQTINVRYKFFSLTRLNIFTKKGKYYGLSLVITKTDE